MENRLTKTQMVINHLRSGKTLTSVEAFRLYKVTRLSGIIHTMRQSGCVIDSMQRTSYDGFSRFVEYRLKQSDLGPLFQQP